MLTPGDILHVAIDWYVVIEAAPEAVLAVTPRSRDEALRIAYEVGNRHFTLALDGERLLLPDDTAMEQLLGRLDVPFERVQSIFVPLGADAFLTGVARAIDERLAPGHHAAAFGAAAGRFGAGGETAAAAYLYSTAALLVGAGLRLLTLGQLDGQRVLAGARPRIARLAAEAARATAEDMWTFTPALELAGLRHARLDLRLFRS